MRGAISTVSRLLRLGGRRSAGASFAALLAASPCCAPAFAQQDSILFSRAPNRQELLIEGAKKEGQVVLYSSAIVNQALRPIAEGEEITHNYVTDGSPLWFSDAEGVTQ